MKLTGLIDNSVLFGGNNIAFENCCPSYKNIYLELEPGEPDCIFQSIVLNDLGGCGTTIVSIGGIPYTALGAGLQLVQNQPLEIVLDYCQCVGVGSTNTLSLVATVSLTNINIFTIEVTSVDPANYQIVSNTQSYFYDCLNNCGEIKDVISVTNPTDFPMEVTFTESVTTGLSYYYNGLSLISNSFFVDPHSTNSLQIANPGCAVTPAAFSIDIDICSLFTVTVPVEHIQVVCGDCGINCNGISISTSGGDIQLASDPTFISGNTTWSVTEVVGGGYVWNTNLFTMNGSGGGGDEWRLSAAYPYTWPYPYPSTQTVNWELTIKTGTIQNTNNVFTFLSGNTPNSIPIVTNAVSNTTYTISYTDSAFDVPAPGTNPGLFRFIFYGTTLGDVNEIEELSMKVVSQPIQTFNYDCSSFDLFNYTAVGDKKTATYNLFYENGFQDFTRLYFNPVLFSTNGNDFINLLGSGTVEPTSGWLIDFQTAFVGAGLQPMTLNSTSLTQKNYEVFAEFVDTHNFNVHFTFYMAEDTNSAVTNTVLDNNRRLLYASTTDLNPLYPAAQSVYNSQKLLTSLFFIYDPNIVVAQNANGNVYYACGFKRDVYFTARYWNLGLFAGSSEMTGPGFFLERNTFAVSNLSTVTPTTLTFSVSYTNPVDTIVLWMIDKSKFNNIYDFVYNYDSSRSPIFDYVGTGVINNHFEGPSQAPLNTFGSLYEVKVNIGTGIDPNGTYVVGAICYSSTDNMVNSFISGEFQVTSAPDLYDLCCDMTVDSSFLDLINDDTSDCYWYTMQERYKHRLSIDAGNLETCLQDVGKSPSVSWLDYLASITIRVYRRVVDYPTVGEYTFFYDHQQSCTRLGVGNWTTDTNFIVTDDGTTISTEWNGRILSDDTNPFFSNGSNVATSYTNTPFDRILTPAATGQGYVAANLITQSWASQEIYLEYDLLFSLTFLTPPIFLHTYQINGLNIRDYEPLFPTNVLGPLEIYGVDSLGNQTLITRQFCSTTYDHLLVKVSTTNSVVWPGGYLVAFIQKEPYTNSNINEYDNFTPNNFIRLTCPQFYDVDSTFTAGEAFFKVDVSTLSNGKYKICALRFE